jgi:PAS domain S-box-containing protein
MLLRESHTYLTDISDRVEKLTKALEEIGQIADFYESLSEKFIDASNDIVIRFNLETNIITFVNQAVCQFWNRPKSDFLGKSIIPFIHKTQRSSVERAREALLKKGDHKITYAIVTDEEKDEYRIVDWHAVVVKNNRNDIIFVQVMGRDATPRLKAMHKKYEREEMLETIIRNNPQGIAIVKNFQITMVNKALTKALGYSVESDSDVMFSSYIHPDDLPMVAEYHMNRMNGKSEEPQDYYLRVRHKQGHYLTFHMRAMTILLGGEINTLIFFTEADEIVKIQHQALRFIINTLAPGEATVLKLLFENKKRADIIRHTGWQSQQIDTYMRRIKEKLGIDDLKKWIDYYRATYCFMEKIGTQE